MHSQLDLTQSKGPIRLEAMKEVLHQVECGDDGLKLLNSILSFDAFDSGLLSFVSSCAVPYHNQMIKPQIITTEETFRLLGLEAKTSSPLICQFNRPFSVGHLKMELLPSGVVLGGTSLHLENQAGRLLYAPALQAFNTQVVRRLQIKRAETLVLNAALPLEKKPHISRNKERDRLLQIVQEQVNLGRQPIIVTEGFSIGPEVAKLLYDGGCVFDAHPLIYKVIRANRELAMDHPKLNRLSKRRKARQVVLIPDYIAMRYLMEHNQHHQHPVIWVQSHGHIPVWQSQGSGERQNKKAEKRQASGDEFIIRLNLVSDFHELKDVIKAVAPKQIYFFGPYAKRYAQEAQGMAPVVTPLFANEQPTLF